jgi:predicted enzyme related to lactoylglutathione lyase
MPIPFVHAITVDCTDPEAMAAFWGPLLGVGISGRWQQYVGMKAPQPGHPRLLFQTVDGPRPEHRTTHVDLHVDEGELEAVTARVLELGGRVLEDHAEDGQRWRVCADPEGNPFCLVPG